MSLTALEVDTGTRHLGGNLTENCNRASLVRSGVLTLVILLREEDLRVGRTELAQAEVGDLYDPAAVHETIGRAQFAVEHERADV